MADYYSGPGTVEGVKEIVRLCGQTVTIGTGKADILDNPTVMKFMADTDELIDSKLSQVYYTPLRKITRGEVSKFPSPIPRISKYYTAACLIMTYYKDIEPGESAAVKVMKEEALFNLDKLINAIGAGSERLEGQKQKARNRFVRPQIAPSTPPTPTAGPAGGIG